MNKPLPWNVKGVGFDAREAARLAAKRAGMPLGEWLNTVIAARAAELGVQVDDVEADDRLEAIAARLSDSEAQAAHIERDDDMPLLVKERQAPVRREPSRDLPPPGTFDTARDAARLAHATPTATRPVPGTSAESMSARFASMVAPASNDAGPRRTLPSRMQTARGASASVAAPNTQADADRLDERLNTILSKLNRSFEAAAEIGDAFGDRDALRRSAEVRPAEIVLPQEAAPVGPPASRVAAKPQAMKSAEPVASTRQGSKADAARTTSFSDMQDAFKALAEKLEAQLAGAQDERASGRAAPTRRAERAQPSSTQDRAAALPNRRVEEVQALQRELARLAAQVADLTPQRSLESLETAVRDLAGRIDLSRLDGVQASVLAPVERLGQEMRDAIRSTDATAAVEAVRRDMKALAAKLEAQPARGADDRAVEALRGEMRGVRDSIGTLAERLSASERLEGEIAALGDQVGAIADRVTPAASRELAQAIGDIRDLLQTFEPHAGLAVIDQKIDHLSARVETMVGARNPEVFFADMMRQIDRAHETLMDRLTDQTPTLADLSGIEQGLGALSVKIDSMGRGAQDVNALYGLVGNLADRMHEAHDPQADSTAFAALQAQMAQLVERLDRTEADSTSLRGLERLIGDLFLQIEQSRNVAIDAAENAARAAAQDTLRAAMDNPTLNGAELTMQTGLDVDHVSQELAVLRRVQETSDRRITGTLTALNTTLERLVDHMLAAPVAAGAPVAPVSQVADDVSPSDRAARRRRRGMPDSAPTETQIASEVPPFDPDHFLIEPGSRGPLGGREPEARRNRDDAKVAPVPQINTDSSAGVAPLIAAARRAAQAAQDSALEASLKPSADAGERALAGQPGKARSFFANRRRPLLLALAGVVLLLGTLQIVRLSTERPAGDVAVHTPAAGVAVPSDQPPAVAQPDKGASLITAPPAMEASASMPQGSPTTTDPTPVGSVPPASVPTPDLAGLGGLTPGLRDLAASGNAAAQFEVASRLVDGKTVTRDTKAGAAWFERAAQQGLAPAQYRLGSAYEKGVGLSADPALAVAWYEKAAAQGNIRAMHNLAVMSAEGAGNKPDYGKAVSWFTKAASYGVRDSQYNLAVLFARGLGVPQNLGQSYAWFALAAQQGDVDAVAKRDTVAAKLDAKALADAKATVTSFHPLVAIPAANDVAPPSGGWDAAGKTAAAHKTEARISSM